MVNDDILHNKDNSINKVDLYVLYVHGNFQIWTNESGKVCNLIDIRNPYDN